MNILITGGSGFIGRTLSAHLIEAGHKVIILSRTPAKQVGKIENVEWVGWNGKTPEGWGHLLETCDAVVNLAGQDISGSGFFPQRWTKTRKKAIRESRIHAGMAVTNAIRMATRKPSVLVQSSGVSIYGSSHEEIITEDNPPGKGFFASLAQEWEDSSRAVESMGVRRVIIRSGVNLSTQSGALPRMMLPFKLYAGGPFGSGKQYLPWIHPLDEARAIHFLIEQRSAHGPFNLVAPQAVTNAEFGKTLGKLMQRPYWLPVPAFAMRLAFGQVADVVLTGQRAIPQRLQELGFKFLYPDLENALQSLPDLARTEHKQG